jgi:hypothetical protein
METQPVSEMHRLKYLPWDRRKRHKFKYSGWITTHNYHSISEKKNYRCNRPWKPIKLSDDETPTFSRQSAHRWRRGQPYARPRFTCHEDSWILVSEDIEDDVIKGISLVICCCTPLEVPLAYVNRPEVLVHYHVVSISTLLWAYWRDVWRAT